MSAKPLPIIPGLPERIVDALVNHSGVEVPADAPWTNLTREQLDRAIAAKREKRGLRGRALALWIMTGDGVVRQAANQKTADRQTRTRTRA